MCWKDVDLLVFHGGKIQWLTEHGYEFWGFGNL